MYASNRQRNEKISPHYCCHAMWKLCGRASKQTRKKQNFHQIAGKYRKQWVYEHIKIAITTITITKIAAAEREKKTCKQTTITTKNHTTKLVHTPRVSHI